MTQKTGLCDPDLSKKTDAIMSRPRVGGKFIFAGDEKLYIRGVTYGPFRPDKNGEVHNDPETVEQDFARMSANGINAIRTYTVPPIWLLDLAQSYGLRVMVGLPWEQHITFLDDRKRVRDIEKRVREGVRSCNGHPAILCYTVGNEIPASIVRWHGRRRMERFIERLYQAVKAEDPDSLVTYINYPTTEYLQLPFVDFVCFNVYLESQDRFEAYLARLQNIAGDRPLVMAEIGLDSRRNGEDAQASTLDWQVRTVFASGCAGAFVFAWTDEWHRGGHDIDDWDFGLTRRDRSEKPALKSVSSAFAEVPFPSDMQWPRISVIVCSYNGAKVIKSCFEALQKLEYPDFEVIVVDDGSKDGTKAIAESYGFRVIRTENGGLSHARNIGLEAATGEIVAYTDDDAYPDTHWLKYLASTFMKTTHAGVGGPNIAPDGDGAIAECVANAPGGPVHVLLSDQEAEHIPGCNMAFRRACLKEIDGFDAQFRVAGDDVDACWRIQEWGWTLGFSPAAMVWHRRRGSVRAYWKQQKGYGKAEAFLQIKWPDKYNAAGHVNWTGKLYGRGIRQSIGWFRQRIYHGAWGSASFQRLYQSPPGIVWSLPMMPEWYLVIAILLEFSILSLLWKPLLLAVPVLVLAVASLFVQVHLSVSRASFNSLPSSYIGRLKLRVLTGFLHLIQPVARLYGRIFNGFRRPQQPLWSPSVFPCKRRSAVWSESWQAPEERLKYIESALHEHGVVVKRGGDYDRHDLEIRGGLVGSVRMRMAVEEHGGGKQLLRFRSWPKVSSFSLVLMAILGALSVMSAVDHEWLVSVFLGFIVVLLAIGGVRDCMFATFAKLQVLEQLNNEENGQ